MQISKFYILNIEQNAISKKGARIIVEYYLGLLFCDECVMEVLQTREQVETFEEKKGFTLGFLISGSEGQNS